MSNQQGTLSRFRDMFENEQNNGFELSEAEKQRYTPEEQMLLAEEYKKTLRGSYQSMTDYYAKGGVRKELGTRDLSADMCKILEQLETPKVAKSNQANNDFPETKAAPLFNACCNRCKTMMAMTEIDGKYVVVCPTCNNAFVLKFNQ